MSIGIGIYGVNGHQILQPSVGNGLGRIVAMAEIPGESMPPVLRRDSGIPRYKTLDELLADPAVELVSLCSPRRGGIRRPMPSRH